LATTAHEELSTSAVRGCWSAAERKIFPLYGRFLAEAGPRAELDHVNTLQEPKDGLGCSYYDLVRFEDETEARPSLVGA
jgi:hypothetical protein